MYPRETSPVRVGVAALVLVITFDLGPHASYHKVTPTVTPSRKAGYDVILVWAKDLAVTILSLLCGGSQGTRTSMSHVLGLIEESRQSGYCM